MKRRKARSGRLAWVLAAVICPLAAGLVTAPEAAAAPPTFVSAFTGSDITGAGGLGPIGFSRSTHVAVDEATGDVYVTDAGNDVVDRFDSMGNYISQITASSLTRGSTSFGFSSRFDDVAVDNSGGSTQGYVYVLSLGANTLFAFDSAGNERWEVTGDGSWCGVGIDPTGHPWIGDQGVTALAQLSPNDGSATGTSISTGSTYCHLGFDNQGSVYAANRSSGGVDKYDQNGGTISMDPGATDASIGTSFQRNSFFTVGIASDNVTPTIRQWDQSGAQVSRIDGTGSDAYSGVAFNGRLGLLYVVDYQAGNVQIYNVAADPPTVIMGSPTNVTSTGGTVNATVNPNGSDVTDCHADYETDAQFSADGGDFVTFTSVPCSQTLPLTGATDQAVSADLTGLTPNTTYHTRIVATNAGATTNGSDTLLLTSAPTPVAPVVVTGAASSIGETGATLAGTVNPSSFNVTDCHIDYGTTTSYGSSVPCSSSPGSGSSAVSVSGAVTGLSAGTTYHFRVVATNAGGTTNGADATFRTNDTCATNPSMPQCRGPPPPTCQTDPSLCVQHIHLNGGWAWSGTIGFLKVKCDGDGGTCAGTLTLKAVIKVKVKKGHKTVVRKKTITVGTASYSLAVGGAARVKVKLASAGKSALKKGGLTATVTSSVDRKIGTVKISKLKVRRKHKRK